MKIICEVCKNLGQLQHLSKNYYRVKHYLGSVNGKLRFEYHKQNPSYIDKVFKEQANNNEPFSIDPIGQNNIDQKLFNNGSISENVWAGSLARLGHPLDVRKVTGSNPVRPTKTDKNVGMNEESTKCG